MNTPTSTEHLTDTLVYKTKGRYRLNSFCGVRLIETEFGRYMTTNKFMHGAEDGDIAQGTIKRTTART